MECITKSLEFAAGASRTRTLRLLSARKGAKRVVVELCCGLLEADPRPHHAQVLYCTTVVTPIGSQFQGQRRCKSPLSWGQHCAWTGQMHC
jgi:hypothetical protein